MGTHPRRVAASSATARPSRSPSGSRSASAPPTTSTSRRSRHRARRRVRRVQPAHARGVRRGQGRVGDQRHQDVDHQRRHRQGPERARGRRVGRPRAQGVAARRASSSRRARPGSRRARSSRRWASAPATPPRSSSTTCACRVAACSAARRSSTRGSPVRAKARRAAVQAAMSTFEASRPLVGAQALGIARAAYEYSLDYAKEREAFGRAIIENQGIAFKLADMKMEIDAARLLVWRACWMGRNGKPFESRRGLDEQAQGGRGRGLGHRAGDPDPRWLRLRARVPGRAVAPRLEDLHDLRGHLGDPAPRHRPRRISGMHIP